jgi:hypothetical protein
LATSKLGKLEKIINFLRNASHSEGLEACGSSANSKPEKYQSAADRLAGFLIAKQETKISRGAVALLDICFSCSVSNIARLVGRVEKEPTGHGAV